MRQNIYHIKTCHNIGCFKLFSSTCRIRTNQKSYRAHIRWRNLILGFGLILGLSFSAQLQAAKVSAVNCDDIRFIFARGSGERLNDKSYQAWQSSITALIRDSGLSFSFYELGARSYGGYQYPAVTVSDGFSGIVNLIGAAISAGEAFEFGHSVEQGKGELKAYINSVSASCPSTKFILGGYSQGAMVVSGILNQIDSSKVIYVSTFGDPKLYLPEGKPKGSARAGSQPDACRGINLSNYRIYVPDCHTFEGVLGSYQPYQPTGYLGKLGTWCNKSDIMCSSGISISDHTSYVSENLYGDAAEKIRQKIVATFPESIMNTKRNTHNLVFLFDTTGSMHSSIDRYQDEAKKLATEVYASGGHVALFEFRDLQEDFPTRELCSFSCTEDEFIQAIDQLEPDGGGDESESLLSAVLTVMNATSWQNGATKSIVALTDAGYHDPDYDGTTYVAVTERSLEIDPVNLYVITQSSNMSKYEKLTADTGGRTFNLYGDISLSTNQIFSRPVAKLSLPEYAGAIGETILFDASESYSLSNGTLSFDWDLDGDGEFEYQNAGATITRQYRHEFDKYIQVRVRDSYGSSTMSAKVKVSSPKTYTRSSIPTLEATMTAKGTAKINFSTNGDRVLLSINDAVVGFTEVTSGNGGFTIKEIDEDARIQLTPYLNNERGIARSVNITKDGEISIEEYHDDENPHNSIADEVIMDSIPKAPDTGTYDRRLSARN